MRNVVVITLGKTDQQNKGLETTNGLFAANSSDTAANFKWNI